MKKLAILGKLLLLSILLLNSLEAIGHGVHPPGFTHVVLEDRGNNGINPVSNCEEVIDCHLSRTITVHIANFDLYDWPGFGATGGSGFLLTPPPTVYLRYSLGSYTSDEIPLLNFTPINHGNVFMQEVTFNIPVEGDCSLFPSSTTGTTTNLSDKIELLQFEEEDGIFSAYPVSCYGDPGEIFDCKEFHHDCEAGCCQGCIDPLSFVEGSVSVCCDECGLIRENSDTNLHSSSNSTIEHLDISPNPFQDKIRLQYTLAEQSSVEIQLFNLNGQSILNLSEMKEAGTNQSIIDTSKLPNGIYYCYIRTKNGTSIQKIAKMN